MAKIVKSGNKPQIDVEKVRYCDNLKDGTKKEFLRCFVYKGGVLDEAKTKDYELDGVTEYTVEGEVTRCIEDIADQCDLVDVWLCDASTGVRGVTEQIWDANGVGGPLNGGALSEAIEVGFKLLDECGLPAHEIATPDSVVTLTKYQSTNINTGSAGDLDQTADQHILESYVKLPEAATLGLRAGGVHAGLFALGPCTGKLKESFRYQNSLPRTVVGFVGGPEIVHVKSYVHDPTQNGSHELEYSLDGGQNWNNIPEEWLFTTPPTVQKVKAYYNKTDCKYYRADDKTEIVETDDLQILCDDPCKGDLQLVIDEPLAIEGVIDVEQVILCDKALTGEITKFIRHYPYTDGVLGATYDTTLDGAAYTPSGIVSDCEKSCGDSCAYWNQTIQVAAGQVGDLASALSAADGNGEYCRPTCAHISVVKGSGVYTYHQGGVPESDLEGDYTGHPISECEELFLGCCGDSCGGSIDNIDNFKIKPNAGETLILSVTLSRPKN